MLGRDWKDVKNSIDEQRILALLSPPPGSPAYALHATYDRDAPAPSPRPASPEEQQKVQAVQNLQAAVSRQLGGRKDPTTADMQVIMSSFGANWAEMLPLYQLAINTMDRDVPTP